MPMAQAPSRFLKQVAIIEVSEKLNPKAVPKNQYYTIISLGVNNSTS